MSIRTTRANTRELKIVKTFLITRDGCSCNICKKDFPVDKLIVEHIDNNFKNWNPDNLQLACQGCNIKKNPPYQNKTDVDKFSLSQGGRDGEGEYLSTVPSLTIDSYSIWKNRRSEPLFRNWLFQQMRKKLRMEVKQVINDGANIAQCSSKTTSTYLDKLVYETGPFLITEDKSTCIRYLEWKEKHFPFKDEIKKFVKS